MRLTLLLLGACGGLYTVPHEVERRCDRTAATCTDATLHAELEAQAAEWDHTLGAPTCWVERDQRICRSPVGSRAR